MRWHEHISVDAEICHGKACVAGTRIPVAVVLANLASGLTPDEVQRSYPGLTESGIRAALSYAAEIVAERVIALPA